MTEPPWTMPAPRRHHLGLVAALIVCLLLVAGGSGLSGYLLYHASRHTDPSWPAGWRTASFTVGGDDAVRVDAGALLSLLAGAGSRYEVRGRRVVVAVPPGRSATLSRLRSLLPIRTELSVRPVLDVRAASPRCSPGGRPACDVAGHSYRLGPPVLSGRQVRGVRTGTGGSGWSMAIRLTAAGQRAIHRYAGRRLAVVMAGAVLLSAPRVSAPVSGTLELSGAAATVEPRRVAAAFRLGRDPVSIRTR